MLEDHIPHTSLIGIYKGNWGDCTNTNWNSTAIAVAKRPTEKLVFVGEDGEVCTYLGGSTNYERTLPKVSMIRSAKTINGYVFACGMKREVYKRIDENQWIDISPSFPVNKKKVGFESIDGFSENEIYAVGWKGEIWQYDGSQWTDHSSLTNLILSSICCAPNGEVYIVGQQGILIRGRHDTWEVVDRVDDVNDDFWDLSYYKNKLYISSIKELFTLENDHLTEVDFGSIDVNSCYSLTQAEGVMWSIGGEDVISFDGKTWKKYN
jgi:hypothetical protein